MSPKFTGPLITISPFNISQCLLGEFLKITYAYAFRNGLTNVFPYHEENTVDYKCSEAKSYVVVEINSEGWHLFLEIVPILDAQTYLLEP